MPDRLERYEIDLRPEAWDLIRWTDSGRSRLIGQRCFAARKGHEQPCGPCPVPACRPGRRVRGVVRRTLEPLVLELVTAEGSGPLTATVSVVPLDYSAVSALVAAPIDALCEKARITPRKRVVLDRTLLGWS